MSTSAEVLGDEPAVASMPSIARHLDVHQHDVGAQRAGQLDGLGAVAGLADHLDVVLDRRGSGGTRSGPAPGRRPAGPVNASLRLDAALGLERQPDPYPVAAGRPRPDLDLAPVGGSALPDAELPEARSRRCRGEAGRRRAPRPPRTAVGAGLGDAERDRGVGRRSSGG